jgi:magnesium-transporting ATPase (P-type)
MITATATKKIKKPVTAKGLNIILSVTTGITILMLLFLILAAVFAGKEEGDATGGGEGDPKTVGTETVVFALLAILMLFAYFILLIVSFIKSLRFRKLGGGKAITSLCTVAFSFGILGIIIAMVGLV